MNIFFLHPDPERAARMMCDQHVIKMPIESAQMLSAAYHFYGQGNKPGLCQPCHMNHPSTIWVRQSQLNYLWLYRMFRELCREYKYRFGRKHEIQARAHLLAKPPKALRETEFTLPPLCMPEEYKIGGTVPAYRCFYLGDKVSFARWTRRPPPAWWRNNQTLPDTLRQKRIKFRQKHE